MYVISIDYSRQLIKSRIGLINLEQVIIIESIGENNVVWNYNSFKLILFRVPFVFWHISKISELFNEKNDIFDSVILDDSFSSTFIYDIISYW